MEMALSNGMFEALDQYEMMEVDGGGFVGGLVVGVVVGALAEGACIYFTGKGMGQWVAQSIDYGVNLVRSW